MAPHRPADTVDLVPAAEPVAARYDQDFYTWTQEQARLLREGRLENIDCAHLAEEIEDLGREQFAKLESALRVLMLHMLKWDYQPERRSRSWSLSIKTQRVMLARVIGDNPGLKPRISEAVAHGYELARIGAALETGLDEDTFPDQCPYAWDDIVGRDFPS